MILNFQVFSERILKLKMIFTALYELKGADATILLYQYVLVNKKLWTSISFLLVFMYR